MKEEVEARTLANGSSTSDRTVRYVTLAWKFCVVGVVVSSSSLFKVGMFF